MKYQEYHIDTNRTIINQYQKDLITVDTGRIRLATAFILFNEYHLQKRKKTADISPKKSFNLQSEVPPNGIPFQ